MAMSPRLLRPIASGVHPEAAAWRSAVVANGGSVSASTMKAVSKFCGDIDAAGIRDRFYRLNLYCGNFNAALVPLYRSASFNGPTFGNATDTNVNFVAGDYVETGSSGGLFGNGTTKYLNCGTVLAGLNATTGHTGFYARSLSLDSTANKNAIGGYGIGFANSCAIFTREGGNAGTLGTWCDITFRTSTTPIIVNGHVISTSVSSTDLRLTVDGAQRGGTATGNRGTTAAFSGNIHVHAVNANGTPLNHIASGLQAYHMGLGLTVAQALAFYGIMQAFQTALGRNA